MLSLPLHLQVNPLAETPEGTLLAADAKLSFDDNAAYRQKDIFALKDESQIDSRCVRDDNWVGALTHVHVFYDLL